MLSYSYPISQGVVTDWDGMEKIWSHAFETLGAIPDQQPILISEAALNPKSNRENLYQHIFETFNAPASYVSLGAVLALYASGRGCGVVLDSGDGATHMVPVYQGYTFRHAIVRTEVTGSHLTDYLVRLLAERGYIFSASKDREKIREIKEKICSVATKSEQSNSTLSSDDCFMLPDGQTIRMESEASLVPEAMFRPSLLGLSHDGVHSAVIECINKCDIDARRDLLGNIILVSFIREERALV